MEYQRRSSFDDSTRYRGTRRRVERARAGSRDRAPRRGGRPLSGPSYQIRPHSIRFEGHPSGGRPGPRIGSRGLVMLAGAIAVLFLLVFGVVGCVRGCAGPKEEAEPVNEADERVAYGTDEGLTAELTPVLDRDEQVSWIAAHADDYADPRIVELALREPEAVSFVRSLPKAEAKAEPYDDEVTQGTVPQLYDWDERWGYVEYGGEGLPLGLTGSGPTCLAMAYMGLTGKSDMTPADMAELAAEGGYDEGDEFCSAELFVNEAEGLGLTCTQIEVSRDQLVTSLGSYVVAARVRPDTLTSEGHWVLVVGVNENGSVTVYDPTSSEVTGHEWAPGTIADASGGLYALAAGAE